MYFEGLILATFVVGACHALSIGANDGANVLGVTVGGGSLSLQMAVLFVIIFELCGAFAAGSELTENARSTYINVDTFEGDEQFLILGILATLLGSTLVIFLYSYWKLPISTTQVTGSGLIAVALVTEGQEGAISSKMGSIALSWVVSPLAGVAISYVITRLFVRTMLRPGVSELRARKFMPIMFGIAFFLFPVYIGLTVSDDWVKEKPYIIISISLGLMITAIVVTHYLVYDWLVELAFRISPLVEKSSILVSSHVLKYGSSEDLVRKVDRLGAERIFCILQLIAAAFFSFSHGANDVANTAAPLSIALHVAKTGVANEDLGDVEIWIPFVYGVIITVGIVLFSGPVTETMAESITSLTPSGGFVVLVSSAIALLINNIVNYPVSTTQVIVGSIAGIGLATSSTEKVKWKTIRVIFVGWFTCVLISPIVVLSIYFMLIGLSDLV
eukprot:TRINITY_DN12947_c0_g1_i1.p1 TRINITY_DN12947_c0_g1~~TRINITY_DN12947_c0_g1_i1.p1  ORF type:complete len:445 (-),score=83.88 TRINITY_DN12947_c0_g1_i1:128-1462(-)